MIGNKAKEIKYFIDVSILNIKKSKNNREIVEVLSGIKDKITCFLISFKSEVESLYKAACYIKTLTDEKNKISN